MTTIYLVDGYDNTDDGRKAFPTIKEARAEGGNIRKVTLADLPIRHLACRLYNHQQFAAKQEDVE